MTGESGPIVLVTGATDGIGRATALALAHRGARVLAHGRCREKLAGLVAELRKIRADAGLEPLVVDFACLDDVRAVGEELDRRGIHVDVLVNNAAVYMRSRAESEEGFEMTLAVNHLAPFALTHALLGSSAGARLRRIINVSSVAHVTASLDVADLSYRTRPFDAYGAYAASKLANVLFTVELAHRLRPRGIAVNALHPGIVGTKLLRFGFGRGGRDSLEEGASTSVRLALGPAFATYSGRYFSDGVPTLMNAAALDVDFVRRFYLQSAEMVRVKPLPKSWSARIAQAPSESSESERSPEIVGNA